MEGKPFRQVLQERIFVPLGMADTDFWLPAEKRNRLASLYGYDDSTHALQKVELEMYEAPPAYTPGGGGLALPRAIIIASRACCCKKAHLTVFACLNLKLSA